MYSWVTPSLHLLSQRTRAKWISELWLVANSNHFFKNPLPNGAPSAASENNAVFASGCQSWICSACSQPSANYPNSRWPRKWADILFMRRKIHFAEPSRDQVTPARILTPDNCPSFKFHLIWIFKNQTPLCRIFIGHKRWIWFMLRRVGSCRAAPRWSSTWLKVNRLGWKHKSQV